MILEYVRMRDTAKPPTRSNPSDAGLDIFFNPENSDRVEISGIKLKNSKIIKEKIYLSDTIEIILNKIDFGRAHHRVIYFVGKKNHITIKELLGVL